MRYLIVVLCTLSVGCGGLMPDTSTNDGNDESEESSFFDFPCRSGKKIRTYDGSQRAKYRIDWNNKESVAANRCEPKVGCPTADQSYPHVDNADSDEWACRWEAYDPEHREIDKWTVACECRSPEI